MIKYGTGLPMDIPSKYNGILIWKQILCISEMKIFGKYIQQKGLKNELS